MRKGWSFLASVEYSNYYKKPKTDPYTSLLQMSQAQNRVYLGADTLMLNINDSLFDANTTKLKPGK